MLTSLRIHNFVLVSHLELDFKEGMTAFTGETGAGKSIMIDALMLALGGRADASVVRAGADTCDIQACFQCELLSSPAQWLQDHDIPMEDGLIILRRVMFSEGRSKSYINGIPFPLQKIKELSEMLVDIHGQHQHQSLLKHTTHRQQLDQYAHHASLLKNVEELYHACHTLQHEQTALKKDLASDEKRELLRYQLEELEQLALEDGETQTLHAEHQLLHHAREYLKSAALMTDLLQADEAPNIRRYLHDILQMLHGLPQQNHHIHNIQELMNNALIQCDEALNEITAFASSLSLDPERLQMIEDRMSAIHLMARKYHVDASQLREHTQHLQLQYQKSQHDEKKLHEIEKMYQERVAQYHVQALQLHQSRLEHAPKLAQEISHTIQQLGMPYAELHVELTPLTGIHAHGCDKVEYKVCTNPGISPDSLAKIASGGELSRISLGIHMITAQRGATPTLLFDEVDVGIGGKTAALVGQLLQQLGTRLQLFCVTHQPQVAACAHHHFMVEKHTEHDQTFSHMSRLEPHDRIHEIARMLGGLNITQQTRAHAQELLEEHMA